MALVRYTPNSTFGSWPDLDLVSNRLSRVFGNGWNTPEPNGAWSPAVSVEEAADELVLTAELPGLREEDVNVGLKNNILTIRGEKREAREEGEEGGTYHVGERRYGSFRRTFTLPRSVQPEGIHAEFDRGILTVRLPKAPEAKSRAIEIAAPKK